MDRAFSSGASGSAPTAPLTRQLATRLQEIRVRVRRQQKPGRTGTT